MDATSAAGRRRFAPHVGAIVVLVIGLLLTTGIAVGTRLLRNDNEDRLLEQRVNEVATVASSAVGGAQARLSAAAALTDSTNADPAAFKALMGPLTAKKNPYASASIWPVGSPNPAPITVVGIPPKLASESPAQIEAVLSRAARSTTVSVENQLGEPDRRLGYTQAVGAPNARYIVYTESQLPRSRKARIASNSASPTSTTRSTSASTGTRTTCLRRAAAVRSRSPAPTVRWPSRSVTRSSSWCSPRAGSSAAPCCSGCRGCWWRSASWFRSRLPSSSSA